MLCVNSYKQDYIDECRSAMKSHLAAYKTLLTAARAKAGTGNTAFNSVVTAFEPLFFNNLVVVLTNTKIKYSPEKSAVGLKIGDKIKLTESAFVALFKAFFAEIESTDAASR
jgi:hypothetical protein